MRVFVTGATGVIGRRVVAGLVAAGHEVTGVARAPEKAALLTRLGATPVSVSLFDAVGLRGAVAGHDAVVNLATKIPPIEQMARRGAWQENERIRREASGHAVDAALAAGASVFVQESLAFLYGDHGHDWVDAAATPQEQSLFSEAVATAEANVARFTRDGGRGIVLRFGRFYAPDSDHTEAMVQSARRGIALDVGDRAGYAPVIDADDAAAAVVAALDAPAGTYDVVDDEPLTRRDQDAALAAAVGRRRLRRLPRVAAPSSASALAGSQRVSNQAYRRATGWAPTSPSVVDGWRKVVAQLGVEPALGLWSRVLLWVFGLTGLALGLQAAFTPRDFYEQFPFGRGWVAMDGLYNEHLIRDFGALNLALAVMSFGALFVGTRAIARVTAGAWFVWSVPHLVYHARHLTMSMSGGDKVGMMVSVALPVVGAVLLWWGAGHGAGGRDRARSAWEARRSPDRPASVGSRG